MVVCNRAKHGKIHSVKRRGFSEKVFDRIPETVGWATLINGRIYKIHKHMGTHAELITSDGIRVLTVLPEFVSSTLRLITGKVAIYLKLHGENVMVAVLQRPICPKCGKDYASKSSLHVHIKKHCKVE